jgi:phage/plasmid-like protein (TIGR03299 family)
MTPPAGVIAARSGATTEDIMHELDFSTGAAAIAYAGETPWHRYGDVWQPGWTIDDWIRRSRINFEVVAVPAYAAAWPSGEPKLIEGCYFNRRSDTGGLLGKQTFTDQRKEVQPDTIARFVNAFVSEDARFRMEVMGAIKSGAQIWATARFAHGQDLIVAGEAHQSFLIARTGFDGTLATHIYMTMVRAVCSNTLAAGWDPSAMVTVRHNKMFDPKAAREQLAKLASQVDLYKAVGDALAANEMARTEVSTLFKSLLDIKLDAKKEDLSTRKANQFDAMARAYETTVHEGAERGKAWAALQAVTRYVDHDRTSRGGNGESEGEKRFASAQFGTGDALKGRAMALLLPRIKDKVAISA